MFGLHRFLSISLIEVRSQKGALLVKEILPNLWRDACIARAMRTFVSTTRPFGRTKLCVIRTLTISTFSRPLFLPRRGETAGLDSPIGVEFHQERIQANMVAMTKRAVAILNISGMNDRSINRPCVSTRCALCLYSLSRVVARWINRSPPFQRF